MNKNIKPTPFMQLFKASRLKLNFEYDYIYKKTGISKSRLLDLESGNDSENLREKFLLTQIFFEN